MDKRRNMSGWLRSILSVGAVFWPLVAMADSAPTPTSSPTVLELFTSQGCSSCPAADRLLGDYAVRGDTIALSFHVDYWDYIGWKDTFATKSSTGRQRGYGQSLSQRHLYTPEIVVAGASHTNGSDRAGIDKLIGEARAANRARVKVELTVSDSAVVAALSSPDPASAEVWLFEIDRRHDVEVRRGENSGKVLSYHNVVREIRRLGAWDGAPRNFSSDLKAAREAGRDGIVVVVQGSGQGAVLGAAQVWLTKKGS